MTSAEELDKLTSKQLHDKAVHLALRRFDAGFFWDLIASLPAAETVAGHPERASNDIAHVSSLFADVMRRDEGELADALRPIYIEYLLEHGS